jgi:hypothetical protein
MEKLIIDRSKWRTGGDNIPNTGIGKTRLLNEEGYMCCLGFACEQSGVPKDVLLNVASPSCLSEESEEFIHEYDEALLNSKLLSQEGKGFFINSDLSDDAMNINDSMSFTRDEREREIQELFGGYGIKVEFINEY